MKQKLEFSARQAQAADLAKVEMLNHISYELVWKFDEGHEAPPGESPRKICWQPLRKRGGEGSNGGQT
jgi:hypothetical protein